MTFPLGQDYRKCLSCHIDAKNKAFCYRHWLDDLARQRDKKAVVPIVSPINMESSGE
ncbi:hypothetical protein DFA_04019 [Cavenderia fasciculata]|uniref:Uncharacterized protein n=1 Tax=Cavenderia fasciculata TaxID=261658 RepID=F4Q124_CACFS|nr:uncharacterized protein DFA_04019 [Cavenderia fasciculata]EGG18525.1 hypothetical protein DFA_04019 [Cavenderia fasciculata]|eukprot:XP_004366429.1 hypothetical protein DFA_04019 [Cavenderia fasciculata]